MQLLIQQIGPHLIFEKVLMWILVEVAGFCALESKTGVRFDEGEMIVLQGAEVVMVFHDLCPSA